jgi:hypothetical protein
MTMATYFDVRDYLIRSELALAVGHAGLAALLRVSQRTVERWSGGARAPSATQLADLARCVHSKDAALAAEIASAAGQTLASLGITTAPRQPSASNLAPARLGDLVVCAAAEQLSLSPSLVRPALRLAFARARELGLDVAAVEAALTPSSEPSTAPAKRPASAKR